MNQPEPQGRQFSTLMSQIENGIIKIPQFQRDFVWSKDKTAALLDSMLKGYPIGTFILWRTKEQLRTVRNIGNAELPNTPEGDYAEQVLDGQQRLTSLYASIKGLQIQRDGVLQDFSKMYVHLEAEIEDDGILVTSDSADLADKTFISLVDLMAGDLVYFTSFPEQYHSKLNYYRQRLTSYSFSIIVVQDAPVDVATEIFTRINVGGQRLSVFEIMVAKTYDTPRSFDLADKYHELMSEFSQIDYGTVPSAVVLQSVSAVLVKSVRKKEILRLDKKQFIDVWPKVADALGHAAEFFRNVYRIPVSNLLPYPALLVPFSYFFCVHPNRPTGEMKQHLEDFFWRVCLSSRYSGTSETRLDQDIRHIDTILKGNLPEYGYGVDTSAEFIMENGRFNAGRAYIKSLLCIMAFKQPRSFEDDSQVRISNDWLKRANSKNYHHFFPRAYLKREGYEDWESNHIANITIVDDFLNKRRIRDKAPARYMKQFAKQNARLAVTMKSHLIALETFGIWDNDYERFFAKRCGVLSRELKKRIISQKADSGGQETPPAEPEEDNE